MDNGTVRGFSYRHLHAGGEKDLYICVDYGTFFKSMRAKDFMMNSNIDSSNLELIPWLKEYITWKIVIKKR